MRLLLHLKQKCQMPDSCSGTWHLIPVTCLQLSQNFQKFFVVWLIRNIVYVLVGELPFFIDDENRSLGNTVRFAIRAESFGDFAFGMKIAEKIVGKTAEALGPCGVARNAVN